MASYQHKPAAPKPGKRYTFAVTVSFEMQFDFREEELQPAEEGGTGDLEPTEEALAKLEGEITEYLRLAYQVHNLEAVTDFDSLRGLWK